MLVAAVAFGALAQGAFFPGQLAVLQVLVAVSLVAALYAVPPLAGDLRAPATIVFAAVSVVTVVSAVLAGDPGRALPQVGFLATLWVATMVVRRIAPPDRTAVLAALFVPGVLVAGTGWFGVAFRHAPQALQNGALWRAASSITYANATACFLALVALVALARRVHDPDDIVAALCAFATIVGCVATLSRGGLLGLGVGALVLAASVGWRRTARATWPVVVGVAVAVAGLVPSFPANGPVRPGLACAGLGAGAAVVVASQWVRLAHVAAMAVLALGTVGLVVPDALAPVAEIRSARLASDVGVSDRWGRWQEFLDAAAEKPVFGKGPEGFLLRYPSFRPAGVLDVGAYAHNEYLQTLAELGAVGLAVVVGGIAFFVRHAARSRPPADDPLLWHWQGACCALVAFAVHSGTDFVWNVPVVPVLAAVLLGMTSRSIAPDAGSR